MRGLRGLRGAVFPPLCFYFLFDLYNITFLFLTREAFLGETAKKPLRPTDVEGTRAGNPHEAGSAHVSTDV